MYERNREVITIKGREVKEMRRIDLSLGSILDAASLSVVEGTPVVSESVAWERRLADAKEERKTQFKEVYLDLVRGSSIEFPEGTFAR